MKLVMLLLVRDEIDIVSSNLNFHLDHGVDHVVAIDNGSIDGTRDVLDDYQRAGVATVVDEPGRNYNQTDWTTRAALQAREEENADFIFSNDADEFWAAPGGNLKDGLDQSDANVLVCHRLNMLYPCDWPDDTPWIDRLVYRVEKPYPRPKLEDIYHDPMDHPYFCVRLHPKIMMRAAGLERISQGNHFAIYDGPVRKQPSGIEIFHFPVRNRAQLAKKVIQGGQAYEANTELPPNMGWHWRRWYRMYQEQGIDAVLADAMPSEAALTADIDRGTAVIDRRFTAIGKGY